MAADDELPKRIEAVFERTGLGNADPEQVAEFVDNYNKAMATADRIRSRKGLDFEEVLSTTEPAPDEES